MAEKSGSVLEKLDAPLDFGVIVALLLSFLGIGKTGIAQKITGLFSSLGRTPAVKQKFGKWFGIGLDDEGLLWTSTLGLLGRVQANGLKKVIAISFLLAAMKDDRERNMFRAILIKVSAGDDQSQEEDRGTDGKPTKRMVVTSKLNTPEDLRVKALETLADVILGSDPTNAFEKKGLVDGKQAIVPTEKENVRIRLALDIVRNQGLGKDSEPVRLARLAWKTVTDIYLTKLVAEVGRFTTERKANTSLGYPKDYHPFIVFWVIERLIPGGRKTPLLNVWGLHFFAPSIRSKIESAKQRWATRN